MRRWVALGSIFLILFALALPARAGLGDLLGGLNQDPISELTEPLAPLVTSVPLVDDLIETTDALTSPIVTVVDSLASPVVTVVDQVADPVIDIVEPVLEDPVAPIPPVVPAPPVPVVNSNDTATRFDVVELSFDQAPIAAVVETENEPSAQSAETPLVQVSLLTSISDSTFSLQDREGNDPTVRNTDWLGALRDWLASGISSLFDVLAIAAHFLEVLLRALTTAGSGLVAPAAILVALAVGGRRRLLPAS